MDEVNKKTILLLAILPDKFTRDIFAKLSKLY